MPNHPVQHRTIDGVECKRCSCCGEWKSVTEYSRAHWMSDRLHSTCKPCRAAKERNRHTVKYAAARVYYSVMHDPLGVWEPERIFTRRELEAAIKLDRIPLGSVLERQDGKLFRLAMDGKLVIAKEAR